MVNIHGPLLNVFDFLTLSFFRMRHFSSFRTNRDRSYTHLKSTLRGLDKTGHMCNFVSSQQTTPGLTVWHIHRFLEVTQSTSEEAKLILLSLRSFFISKKKIGRRRRARRGCRGRRWAPLPLGLSQRKIFRFYFPKHESWLRNINIFDQNQNAFPTRIRRNPTLSSTLVSPLVSLFFIVTFFLVSLCPSSWPFLHRKSLYVVFLLPNRLSIILWWYF